MSRRAKPEIRNIQPDVRYHNVQVQAFINNVMRKGKKSVAARLVYDAIDLVEQRMNKNGLEVFESAIKNVSPMMEVKPRRVGGATYQIPMEVALHLQLDGFCRLPMHAPEEISQKN
jgi:small subunit ribosomal protein S7